MSDVLMEMDDDSVLRWEIADFLQRWRQADDGDVITSGLFVLKSEDGSETRFFLQLDKETRSNIHFRCLNETSDWTGLFENRPLWIEREDGTKSAEKSNIVSFTADRTEATVEFKYAISEYWDGRLDLLVNGYRIVPQLPPLRMDEGGPVNSRFDQKFNDAAYTDVRIVVDDRIFHVYKAFLFLHSDVFRAMFEHAWKERESNAIPIEGIEPEIVEAMLRFMYTGRVENLEQNARYLFLSADKYNVKLLRDLTVDHMCAQVCLENVVEMLGFALEHPTLKKLREWALDFAARHYPQLHDRPEWKEFAAEHPPLVLRLMEKVVVHE
ncbi:Speckle-type POZ protein-like isoform X2 [Aphelenchoides fujianensis]|nr:Speckle-type POZ protein-like isoform X2 [Aphelenchoides fujianensis]